MVFTAFRAIEGTRGENPLIYMIFRRYRYHSAIIISRIQPDIAVERNSRQAKAENSTENRILHWFLKGIFIFAQWFWGPQLVLYKWLWSKLSNYSMIFRPKMHDFGTYLTIVQYKAFIYSFIKVNFNEVKLYIHCQVVLCGISLFPITWNDYLDAYFK